MEEKHNIMILERNKEFSINTSTNPTNVAKGYEDGTLRSLEELEQSLLFLDGAIHIFRGPTIQGKTFQIMVKMSCG